MNLNKKNIRRLDDKLKKIDRELDTCILNIEKVLEENDKYLSYFSDESLEILFGKQMISKEQYIQELEDRIKKLELKT